MKISVLYFSRTGVTKEIAGQVSKQLATKVFEINDEMSWSGIFGYIKGGYYASSNKSVEITYDKSVLDSDVFIIMTPVWAGGPVPAIRSFLKDVDNTKVCLLLTNDGSDMSKIYKKTKEFFPKISSMYGITKRLKNKDQVIAQLVKDVK